LSDDELLALAKACGAREEGVGQGGAYRELVLRCPIEPSRPDLHLRELRLFADAVTAHAKGQAA
jgi:hypothetical protein